MRGSRALTWVLVGFLVLLVNAPLVRTAWADLRLSRDGVTAPVAVLDSTERDGGSFLALDLDPDRVVQVDATTYAAAVAAGEVDVTRLPGADGREAGARVRVEGQVRSPVSYVVVGALDLALLAGVVLWTRVRPRLRPELVLRAMADAEEAAPGSVLDRVEEQSYVVAGVVAADPVDDEVVLDLGDRRVRVVLDGHACPVPSGSTARVSGVMIA